MPPTPAVICCGEGILICRELALAFSQAPAGGRGEASLRSLEQGLLLQALPAPHALAGFKSPPRHLLRPYASHTPPNEITIRSSGMFVHRAVTLRHMASQTQALGCQKNSDAWGAGVGWGYGLLRVQVNATSASLHPSPHFLRCLPNLDF